MPFPDEHALLDWLAHQSLRSHPTIRFADDMTAEHLEHARGTAIDWRPLINALIEEVAAECRSANWDGYGAQPIRRPAMEHAQRFVDLLPTQLRGPDPVPNPDGNIALSWDFGPRCALTIDVGEDGTLTYAALLGRGVKRHGVEHLSGHIPRIILETLDELHGLSGAAG